MVLAHELSWSTSRARTLEACARRYYYEYYLSWRGWERDAEPLRRKAYLLKKMSRLPLVAGDVVHRAIAEWFRRRAQGRSWTLEEATASAVGELRAKYKESRDGAWRTRPSKACRLAEHHYSEPRIDEATGAAGTYGKEHVERIRRCLATFFESPLLAEARESAPGTWLACEELSTFELFGTKVYAVPDFAYRRASDAGRDGGAGDVVILDWKTGRPRAEDRAQLEVYAFYARERFGAEVAAIRCSDVYLATGEIAEVAVAEAELEESLARIAASLERMRALHFDAALSAGDAERFPMIGAESPEVAGCRSCNFRELCER